MDDALPPCPLSGRQCAVKRGVDVAGAVAGLALTWWLILVCILVATIETRVRGLFVQERIGQGGMQFPLIKIRTMHVGSDRRGSWTVAGDRRITRSGALMRRFKLDELPQLLNVLAGHMSLVGPRPDVAGFADELAGEDRVILTVRPGITGPATVAYRNEEDLLAQQEDAERYNRELLFPAKVAMTREYLENYSLLADLRLILATVGVLPSVSRQGSCWPGGVGAGPGGVGLGGLAGDADDAFDDVVDVGESRAAGYRRRRR